MSAAGTLLAVAPGDVRWLVYVDEGAEWAAPYLRGCLVRRDAAGWWSANGDGSRVLLAAADLDLLAGTAPDEPPILPEVAELGQLVPRDQKPASAAEEADRRALELIVSATAKRTIDGASFVFDAPERPVPIWGRAEEALAVEGEPLLIVGPTGVGKTTLGQQWALGRMGLREEVLGLPVRPDERRVLYLAADRPAQAARSMRRMVTDEDREALAARLVVWRGPLSSDLGRSPDVLVALALDLDAGTVVIDSLKDVASKLSDDEAGSKVNQALQLCVVEGVEVLALHHQRKAQAGAGKPRSIADVYGSTWITAGAGSVVLLWGEPGDAVVELTHLKQPAEPVGPLTLLHDHEAGITTVQASVDLLAVVRTSNGLTAEGAARSLFLSDKPKPNEVERARRKLERLVKDGQVVRRDAERGGASGSAPCRYYLAERRPD